MVIFISGTDMENGEERNAKMQKDEKLQYVFFLSNCFH